jgi:hypothetical protein
MYLSSIVSGFALGLSTPSKKITVMGPYIRIAPLCEGANLRKFISILILYWSGLEPSKYTKA